jgi:hypothetical protein
MMNIQWNRTILSNIDDRTSMFNISPCRKDIVVFQQLCPIAVFAVTKFNQKPLRENEFVFRFPGGED